jgi:hypothetical protein
MGSRQREELVETPLGRYHHMLMNGVLDRDDEKVTSLTDLAGAYADEVIASLPEDDPEILRKGLMGAFLSFFVDAAQTLRGEAA